MEPLCICDCNLITAYGEGIDPLWKGFQTGKSAIEPVTRFSVESYEAGNAALIDGLVCKKDESMLIQMLKKLKSSGTEIPENIDWLFASSKGEIDLFEASLRIDGKIPASFGMASTLRKISSIWGFKKEGIYFSGACASSSIALAHAARTIESGGRDAVAVITADIITPFTFSGFSSLSALDPLTARPFDKTRKGLTLGEGAAFALIMKRDRAIKENRTINGYILGWGCSDDANHATGPSRDGSGLKLAIESALEHAGLNPIHINSIKAHGTGTLYNDSMELKAFSSIFTQSTIPVYSIKGGTGHTLGACGLIEVIFALKSSLSGTIPMAVNVMEIDSEAMGWVTLVERRIKTGPSLCVNSGFGGINSAIIVAPYNGESQ